LEVSYCKSELRQVHAIVLFQKGENTCGGGSSYIKDNLNEVWFLWTFESCTQRIDIKTRSIYL